jgi:hypothetical protein
MAGTIEGGRRAAETNMKKYGPDFYKKIGSKGGKSGNTGGFASALIGNDGLTGYERASVFGAVGGRVSRRTKRG